MKDSNTQSKQNSLPRWLLPMFVLGIPTVVTIIGLIMGAHVAEIVIFSMLCLFSLALVLFYGLG